MMSDITPPYIMLVSCLCVFVGLCVIWRACLCLSIAIFHLASVCMWMSEDILTVGVCLAAVIAAALYGRSVH